MLLFEQGQLFKEDASGDLGAMALSGGSLEQEKFEGVARHFNLRQ